MTDEKDKELVQLLQLLQSKIGEVQKQLKIYGPQPRPEAYPLNVCYFQDEKREIDYILVCSYNTLDSKKEYIKLMDYIGLLEDEGIEFEYERGSVHDDFIFIKVHVPTAILLHYGDASDIKFKYQNNNFMPKSTILFKFMANEVTKPNAESVVFKRAIKTLSGARETNITPIERIMFANKILVKTGIEKLIISKTFSATYPIHDGTHRWANEGPLNDRQLLGGYWANIGSFYKEQPLDLIEKYYGPEVAFYFAWLQFYNKMLVPASIGGILCFFLGLISVATLSEDRLYAV